jgi:Zn-dependent peptidase ImmA (M78 family)/transcriptional regulator with XRE-family HTH domain
MQGISERVVRLIEASGLSRGDFARRIGLDDSKLSKSLGGTRRFSSLDLSRIADQYDVTVDWLVTGEEPALALAARTTGGQAGAALKAARLYTSMRADMASLGYPQPWRPVEADAFAAGGTYAEQGQKLAGVARDLIVTARHVINMADLPSVVEDVFGVDVAVVGLDEGFDGLAASSDGAKLIVLATSRLPARQRYTLAHELGHLLAGDDQDVHLDRDIYDRAQVRDPSEMRANSFASAFLMPADRLRDAIGPDGVTEPVFAELACELRVSPSALAFRMLQLRFVDAGRCDRYKRITAARAASIAGRGDDFARSVAEANKLRPPGLLVRDAYAAYETGAATLRPYANLLGVDVDDLRRELESEDGIHDPS